MITELQLLNFRNYVNQTFIFHPLTVIIGPNGTGKTNIIEAVFLLSTGRSFRTGKDAEMIRFGSPFARVMSEPLDLTITNRGAERTSKQLRLYGKPQRLLTILGVQPSVLFTPASLALIDGPPALRRQFIDILLSQTDQQYARSLLEYQRILRQRNELLHQIQEGSTSAESLVLWDDLLVQASVPVMIARKRMATEIHQQIDHWYQRISARPGEVLAATYLPSVEKRQTVSDADLEPLFRERLRERRVAELQAGRTLIGPHRDDFVLLLNKRPVADYGSRGQMRSAVVALKLFEYGYIKEQSEKAPTLLFDDVFSEFDQERRKAILKVVPEAQLIFTATDLKHVGRLPARARVIDLATEITEG